MTIKDFEEKSWNLSDEIYEILDDSHPSHKVGYGKGDKVRLIDYPSYDPEYSVVCRVSAKIAGFCGIKKTSLKKLE